jgi:outer membrane receptor protein involved in Fe transport
LGRTASLAAYATDEWQIAPRWRVDAGLRHEWEVLRGIVGIARSIDLSTPASMANRAVQVDSGQSAAYASSFAATNATLALHWQARPETFGLFARVSMGHGALDLSPPGGAMASGAGSDRDGATFCR